MFFAHLCLADVYHKIGIAGEDASTLAEVEAQLRDNVMVVFNEVSCELQ